MFALAFSAWFYVADEGVFVDDEAINLRFRFLKRRIPIKDMDEMFELTLGEGVDNTVILHLTDGSHLFLPERLGLADYMRRVSLYHQIKMTRTTRQYFPNRKRKSPP
ncbi:MAG: hypothetical protein GC165_12760 [Armatimonadetes bacterium]|nr:hypothetical protein [Armatimonadota bacterium]